MQKFLKSLLSDERGQQSTKRILAMVGTLFLCSALVLNLSLCKGFEPNEELVSAIEFIVIACIGATTLDKFSHRVPKKDNNVPKKP